MEGLYGDCAGYLLVVNDKVRVALVVIEDDIDLGVHPVVHTGVIKVTGGITGVDGWRSSHGGISYSQPVRTQRRFSVTLSDGDCMARFLRNML